MADVPLIKLDAAASDGQVPTADGAGGYAWETPAGTTGAAIAHKHVLITTGTANISTSGAWQAMSTHLAQFVDLELTGCSVGDVIEVTISALWEADSANGLIDVATIVAGSPVNHLSTGGSTRAGQGVRGWFGNSTDSYAFSHAHPYALQAGDLDAGAVTVRAYVNTSAAKDIYCGSGIWGVKNLGPAQA